VIYYKNIIFEKGGLIMSFKIGDKVRLKSGGPIMTVAKETDPQGFVVCQWFHDNILKENSFQEGVLQIDEFKPVGGVRTTRSNFM
jgi:uncharacterized protein YodC (DUF2158 family)